MYLFLHSCTFEWARHSSRTVDIINLHSPATTIISWHVLWGNSRPLSNAATQKNRLWKIHLHHRHLHTYLATFIRWAGVYLHPYHDGYISCTALNLRLFIFGGFRSDRPCAWAEVGVYFVFTLAAGPVFYLKSAFYEFRVDWVRRSDWLLRVV